LVFCNIFLIISYPLLPKIKVIVVNNEKNSKKAHKDLKKDNENESKLSRKPLLTYTCSTKNLSRTKEMGWIDR
jgi:hypothetical protein